MGVPVWERVKIRPGCAGRGGGSAVMGGGPVVGVASGTMFSWLRFLLTAPLSVVTSYDLGAVACGSAMPSEGCPSVVTHTFVPGGSSGNGRTR